MLKKYEIHLWDDKNQTYNIVREGRQSLLIKEARDNRGVLFYEYAKPEKMGLIRVGTPNNTNSWNGLDYFETNFIVKVDEEVQKENGDVEIEFQTEHFKYKWVDKNIQMM